jgi:hypothetical protein
LALLASAVALVGVLCLLNLLLMLGVIRRLREHGEMISRVGMTEMPVIGLTPGERVAAFSAVTTGGQSLTSESGLRVAAFFSSSCSICPERAAPFADYLSGHRVLRDSVLTVVVGSASEPPPYLDRLADSTQICVVPDDAGVIKAFKVKGFPAFFLLDAAGTVLATGYDPAMLPHPALAS